MITLEITEIKNIPALERLTKLCFYCFQIIYIVDQWLTWLNRKSIANNRCQIDFLIVSGHKLFLSVNSTTWGEMDLFTDKGKLPN